MSKRRKSKRHRGPKPTQVAEVEVSAEAQADSEADSAEGEGEGEGEQDGAGEGEASVEGVDALEACAEGAEPSEPDAVEARAEGAEEGSSEGAVEASAAGEGPSEQTEAELTAQAEAELSAPGELGAEGEGDEVEAGDAGAELPLTAAQLPDEQLKSLLEALIFASDKPLTLQRIRQLTRVSDMPRLTRLLDELSGDYIGRGLALTSVSGGYQFRTATGFSQWVQQLIAGRPVRLSRAQLETLAIVAYRQPITRPEIDDIRGVDSGATLKLLLDRALIRVLGKKEEPGRPILYGTTREFLDFFSLGDLRELPTLREYSELSPESQEVLQRKLGSDEVPAAAQVEAPAEAASMPELADAVPAVVAAEGSGPHPAAETWS